MGIKAVDNWQLAMDKGLIENLQNGTMVKISSQLFRRLFLIALVVNCQLSIVNFTWAQVDYNKQYFNGKQLFREGKYNLAMETFKSVIPYDQNNQFSDYASFYYALSAYNMGYRAVAKDMFNQIKKLNPSWDKIDEVNFWLAKIHFDNKDYFQGVKILAAIQDKKLKKNIDALKTKAIGEITDVETLKMMREEYPNDEIIARVLAGALSKDLTNPDNLTVLEALITQFNFKRTDFIPEAPKTFFKDTYSVSVLFPFMVSTLEPSTSRKRNQIVLDLYEGMKQAVDTLAKQGVKISLRAYDTERSPEKIKNILSAEELKSSDLIVGPFFQEENKAIQDFSFNNKINIFNPLSNNTDVIGVNPYAFLYQPSYETIGRKTGEFLPTYVKRKNCIVYYGTAKRDSIVAANFVQVAKEKGVRILSAERITREALGKITSTLATPTEYDEFKYPKQFTLKKDSLGSIFVASDDALIYAKVLNGVETRGDTVLVLGSENWLDQTSIDMEKYQTLPVVLAAPNFTRTDNPYYRAFVKKFIRTHGRMPSAYAKMGYEFMLFAGKQLKKSGVYFQEGMNQEQFIPGQLVEGYNFQLSRDNQHIPFVRFKKDKVLIIDKK